MGEKFLVLLGLAVRSGMALLVAFRGDGRAALWPRGGGAAAAKKIC